jgi:hypothetical protein
VTTTNNLFKEVLTLSSYEQVQIVDTLIPTINKSDKEIYELWAKEADHRIDACDQRKVKAIVPVFKYKY